MSNRTFKIAATALVVMMLFFLREIGNNTPEAQAQQQQQALAQQTREQLVHRITQPYNKMVSMCDYLAQFSYLAPQAQLPSTCANLRTAGIEAIARIKMMKDLNLLSRQVDEFEIKIAPELRTMETSYATVRQIMDTRR